jgi:hypothetical protein
MMQYEGWRGSCQGSNGAEPYRDQILGEAWTVEDIICLSPAVQAWT